VFYTFFGSSFMLVGILVTGFAANTFDMRELAGADLHDALLPTGALFFFLIMAFAIKLPVFPFHTWLPDAHTDAPTAVSVMLAGVLLKMGGYGMLRVTFTILPDVARDASLWLGAFAVVNILYGAVVTMVQTDLKRLIAYSSVSHMGYVLLGMSALGTVGLTGAGMQMLTHGLITGLLFVMVGLVYDRTHTRQIRELSGLAHQMPVIAVVMVIAGLASLGLPSLAGFVSEVTVFLGTFGKYGLLTVMAVIGILLTAGYILWMIQRVFYGERNPRWADLGDAHAWWELSALAAMVGVIVLIGIYPAVVADVIEMGVQPIAASLA
jgi:NADH-quinone oxidoreductase subunit M